MMRTSEIPEVDLTDPAVVTDPFGTYGRVREQTPVARLLIPGMAPLWAVLRYHDAKAALSDPRFELSADSFAFKPAVPEDCEVYLRTMQEMEGPEHLRLRRLVAPAFTPRRPFRSRIEPLVDALLGELGGEVDLVPSFARPLPIDVICELVGIPVADRDRWREYGAHLASGAGAGFAAAVPGIIHGARSAVRARRAEPGDDLISDLLRTRVDGDRLTDVELVTLVWNIVLAGQTPTNLIANAVAILLDNPEWTERLRAEPALMPTAVEELMRWCGPQIMTIPRFARADVEIGGITVPAGAQMTVVIASANRDRRAFAEPERLDLTRDGLPHLGFAHGAHFCLGAGLARVQTELALSALLSRFQEIVPAGPAVRAPDPGTWRLTTLPVRLG